MEVGRMRTNLIAALGVLALVVAGCGDDDSEDATAFDDAVVEVVSIGSLEPLLRDLETAFGRAEPDVDLDVNIVDGSDEIREAVDDGADVVIGPDVWLGNEGDEFGQNRAVIAVPEGNPADLGLDAFAAGNDATVVACSETSALGDLTLAVLALNDVTPDPAEVQGSDSCRADALGAVAAGDLDAALVFRGGVEVPTGVELVEIPDDRNIVFRLVTVAQGGSEDARAFTAFLDSDEARTILTARGYLT